MRLSSDFLRTCRSGGYLWPFLLSLPLFGLYHLHWECLVDPVVREVGFGRPRLVRSAALPALAWATWGMASYLAMTAILALLGTALLILWNHVRGRFVRIGVQLLALAAGIYFLCTCENPVGNSLPLIRDSFDIPVVESFVVFLSGAQKTTLLVAPAAFSACVYSGCSAAVTSAEDSRPEQIARAQKLIRRLLVLSAIALVLGVAETRAYYGLAATAGGHAQDPVFMRFAAQYAALTGALYAVFLTVSYVSSSRLLHAALQAVYPPGPKSEWWLEKHGFQAETPWRAVQPLLISASPFLVGVLQAAATF